MLIIIITIDNIIVNVCFPLTIYTCDFDEEAVEVDMQITLICIIAICVYNMHCIYIYI